MRVSPTDRRTADDGALVVGGRLDRVDAVEVLHGVRGSSRRGPRRPSARDGRGAAAAARRGRPARRAPGRMRRRRGSGRGLRRRRGRSGARWSRRQPAPSGVEGDRRRPAPAARRPTSPGRRPARTGRRWRPRRPARWPRARRRSAPRPRRGSPRNSRRASSCTQAMPEPGSTSWNCSSSRRRQSARSSLLRVGGARADRGGRGPELGVVQRGLRGPVALLHRRLRGEHAAVELEVQLAGPDGRLGELPLDRGEERGRGLDRHPRRALEVGGAPGARPSSPASGRRRRRRSRTGRASGSSPPCRRSSPPPTRGRAPTGPSCRCRRTGSG